MRFSLLLLVSAIAFTGCCKQNHPPVVTPLATNVERLVFGTYYGECAGNCVNIYSLDRATLQKGDSSIYPALARSYSFSTVRTLSDHKHHIARELLNSIPEELLSGSRPTFGDPDGHDQGGMYIEIFQGKTGQRFLIDLDNTPDQSATLISFKKKVAEVLWKIR